VKRALLILRLLLAVLVVAGTLEAGARQVPITILHTCDLHGNILPTVSYEGETNLGGLARCATVIEQVRQEVPHVLVVDAGDTVQGTAVSWLTGGQVMVRALNAIRYDAWVCGNHEFDWGLEKLAACAEQARMPLLNANVSCTGSNELAGRIAARLTPYVIREVDGVKVGIIGLNTPGIPNWSRPGLLGGLWFADSVETLRRVVPELRKKGADVLVLVCHQGYREGGDDHANQIKAIAENFPELDVIIGGHTHRHFPELKIRNVLYCQADYYGIHLGRVDLVYDTDQKRLVQRTARTYRMDAKVTVDAGLMKMLGGELERAQKHLDIVVGEAAEAFGLEGAPKRESPVHALICEAIAAGLQQRGVKVDAVVHGILDSHATLQKGPVRVRDVWKIMPYENTIGVVHVTPSELREILDENAAAYEKREFRGIWGLKWEFYPSATNGNRTVSLTRADGLPLPEEKRLAVAFNSYDLASGGLRWRKLREVAERPEVKLEEFNLQTREALIEYIRSQKRISSQVTEWWQKVRRPNRK